MVRYDARADGGVRAADRRAAPSVGSRPLTGRLHSVESFGTLDGPGIRQVLFFQGCHLRCAFCQNRDTWDPRAGRAVTVDELVAEVLRYRVYMDSSGGGVTASGGDPILQAPFVAALFRALRTEGIHTALDTSGAIAVGRPVADLIRATDLVLLDLKHMDSERHRELTGVPNTRVLEFARSLAATGTRAWIRHVVIPGWNADRDHARRLATFLREIAGVVERVELLPYHEHGRHKWEATGARYRLDGTRPPEDGEMETVRREVAATGIPVFVA